MDESLSYTPSWVGVAVTIAGMGVAVRLSFLHEATRIINNNTERDNRLLKEYTFLILAKTMIHCCI